MPDNLHWRPEAYFVVRDAITTAGLYSTSKPSPHKIKFCVRGPCRRNTQANPRRRKIPRSAGSDLLPRLALPRTLLSLQYHRQGSHKKQRTKANDRGGESALTASPRSARLALRRAKPAFGLRSRCYRGCRAGWRTALNHIRSCFNFNHDALCGLGQGRQRAAANPECFRVTRERRAGCRAD